MPLTLAQLTERWKDAPPAERANFQSYVIHLCEALGVEPPGRAESGYEFERPIRITERDGTETTNFVDCWKAGHFAIEGKHLKVREQESEDLRLRRAFGQVKNYVSALDQRPPYIMVLDVGRTLLLWDRWSGDYGGFGVHRRIDLAKLADRPDDAAFLKAIWTDPAALDPRARAEAVTKEIAATLAELAGSLEYRGHDQEAVARFLIRVVFTMFAEDVDLLPADTFVDLISDVAPAELPEALEDLWRVMDRGGRFGGRAIPKFNGHFFRDAGSIPLTKKDCDVLTMAAMRSWEYVEPSIFGTLLVRALDPVERHRLGAEFTPREYVERLVRPTVEEPIREKWTAVQAEALQLRETGKEKDRKAALKAVQDFHEWLCGLRFLDPACGSGNFLYVTLHIVKRVELEVRQLENDLRKKGDADLRLFEVHPRQFHGIEIKHWAREIAELTLWIGYHQFWREHAHVQYQPPILEDTGTIECRDAVLAWDAIRHDPSRDRPDPTPRIPHPVTGKLVPDPKAKLEYMEYVNPRPAEWPRADFIVGNPPYLGRGRQRESLGDGYVDSLRATYPAVSENADLVMYWWHRASEAVADGGTSRAGLITTNSITQRHNRITVERGRTFGVSVVWTVPDHPWVDEEEGAAVRVAMTVFALRPASAVRVSLDQWGNIQSELRVKSLNSDLTAHADVATTSGVPLISNKGLSSQGFTLVGSGFLVDAVEARKLLRSANQNRQVLRPILNGKDVSNRPRGHYVVDYGFMDEAEARSYPQLFDLIRDRVRPTRQANSRRSYAEYWWRFGEPRRELRRALEGLPRSIVTLETAKHRFFTFVEASTAIEHKLICIADQDAYALGILSSELHEVWSLAAGGRLEDRPVYQKAHCFDPFPFPSPTTTLRARIAAKAEQLDAHRKAALARDERVTMTGMYNVVEKLRSGEPLTRKEREVHEIAACGVLKDLHDELDALVAQAYGWPWPLEKEAILERLVALHDERVEEEKAGKVRWLRPDYQIPRFGKDLPGGGELALTARAAAPKANAAKRPAAWPATAAEQIGLVKSALDHTPRTAAEVAAGFSGARTDLVERHLDTLALLGEVRRLDGGRYLST